MKDPVDRPPPYIANLFEAERAAPRPAQDVQDRVRVRVAATLIAATTTSTATMAAAAKGASGALALLTTKVTLIAVAVVSVGAAEGFALHQRRVHEWPLTVTAKTARSLPTGNRLVTTPSPAPTVLAAPIPEISAAVTPPALRRSQAAFLTPSGVYRRRGGVMPTAPADVRPPGMKLGQIPDGLFDENTLIEAARTALEAQDSPSAIAFLERHARLHPTGQMEEEREALWVRALAAEGDGVDARARAAHFRRRFPRSIQLQVVSAALDTIP